ncbi:MAG TPA: phosphoenolpyruvate carboxykinase [Actinomycetota bacterium]|nr:phosphoenolpyruvate carboxykinase [Actinomycetota bacterium]
MTEKLEGPNYVLEARSFLVDPTQEQLIELTAKMPNAKWTKYGNLNVKTRVDSRSTASTFIVTDTPEAHEGHKTMPRDEFSKVVEFQEAYIRDQDMVVINGFIGNDPEFRVPARLIIEAANANIAGSQDLLYFKGENGELTEPAITIIYTPNLKAPDYPSERCIAVDLDNGVTRVMYPDYFGESKKGGLRMWNKIVYDRGGIPLHAGCKVIPMQDGGEKTLLIIGLSGTGKTTTTFTRQNDSKPVQDDFVALMPGGKVYGTENGCFAKTYALSAEYEPTIHGAVTSPGSYLENVSQKGDGDLDFFDESFTANGRAVFAMEKLGWYKDARECLPVEALLILNRNTNIVPAVARLPREAAAAYFMLGETQGTSAGGKDEAGKALRVPGTNPFFPLAHALQGNRFFEILQTAPMDIYLMNTGWIGGDEADEKAGTAKKVKIPVSSAVVKAIADGTIEWELDPDFGYEVATKVPGIDDPEFLNPRLLYERQGRADEYAHTVARLKEERTAFLAQFKGLRPEIVSAI